ncbi:MAG: hypothetical protein U9N86_04905 [Bacteroidota bacterium]|nr:hypothetical protein [Bacteroidota bacterium]
MITSIGGISRSGKSFLAEKLKELLEKEGNTVKVLDQDDYVYPEEDIPLVRDHIDWEGPESIDWGRFIEAISEAEEMFDHVIVEGLMTFWNPSLRSLFNKCIFIKLSQEEFMHRKQNDLRWGKEPAWYVEHIWDSYVKYGQIPDGMDIDLVLDGERMFDIEMIFRGIFDVS